MIQSRFTEQIKRIVNLTHHIDVTSSIESIKKTIEFSGPNVWILFFAVVIASVGLNVNSIAVIIGAMLISPLMGPITGVGLALGINDSELLKKSIKNLGIMVIISLSASCAYFILTPLDLEAPTELLARTNPTIYDVFIALFGGLAAIIEVCRKEKGTVIAGAAIATALMPPLCTAGYGLANGNIIFFLGAMYLFFINSVFISLASYIIVRYLHFPFVKFADPAKQKTVRRRISFFTLILIIPSIYSGIVVISENRLDQDAKKFVNENKSLDRSYIYDYKVDHHKKPSQLILSIAGEKLSDANTNKLYESLADYDIDKEQLILEQSAAMIQDDINDKEVVKGIFERADQEVKIKDRKLKEMEETIQELRGKELPHSQIALEIAAHHPDITSMTLSRGIEKSFDTNSTNEQVIVIIKVATKIEKEELTKLKNWLEIRLETSNIRIIQEVENNE